jgi:hypothetical protein
VKYLHPPSFTHPCRLKARSPLCDLALSSGLAATFPLLSSSTPPNKHLTDAVLFSPLGASTSVSSEAMAEVNNEKVAGTNTAGADTPSDYATNGAVEPTQTVMGKPWMYKRIKLGPITLPHYASPNFQVGFVAMVCFLCPGMFNAVNGLGAGGLVSAHDINNANVALYSTFAGVGFFCGSIANRIGLRLTLGIGGFGYFLYICSILSYNHNGNAGFLIFAGALLGFCAAMLWTAQGAVMMSYPSEGSKGRSIAWFWVIFNLGGVIGALVCPWLAPPLPSFSPLFPKLKS